MTALATLVVSFALLAPLQQKGPVEIENSGLTLDTSSLPELSAEKGGGDVQRTFRGTVAGTDVKVFFWWLPVKRFGAREPEHAVARFANQAATKAQLRTYHTDGGELLRGPYGSAPFAILLAADFVPKLGKSKRHYFLGGALDNHAYCLEVQCDGIPSATADKKLRAFLASATRYDGAKRDRLWSEKEAREFWDKLVPEEQKSLYKKAVRGSHFIVLGGSRKAKALARALDKSYVKVRKALGLVDAPHRLLPAILFDEHDQYALFGERVFKAERGLLKQAKGLAGRGVYATWEPKATAAVHLHEVAHLVMSDLMRWGGGAWFREGMAALVSEPAKTIKAYEKSVAKGGPYVSLARFFAIDGMPHTHQYAAGDRTSRMNQQLQAASLLSFLETHKKTRADFARFCRGAARTEPKNVEQVSKLVEEVYGVQLYTLEEWWLASIGMKKR